MAVMLDIRGAITDLDARVNRVEETLPPAPQHQNANIQPDPIFAQVVDPNLGQAQRALPVLQPVVVNQPLHQPAGIPLIQQQQQGTGIPLIRQQQQQQGTGIPLFSSSSRAQEFPQISSSSRAQEFPLFSSSNSKGQGSPLFSSGSRAQEFPLFTSSRAQGFPLFSSTRGRACHGQTPKTSEMTTIL